MELLVNEKFKNLIPSLSDEEYEQLEENLTENGCREPLTVWNEVIIDGHNRYKICKENNIDFSVVEKQFADESDAEIWIIKNQFGRRNLDAVQRARLALQMKEKIALKAKANQVRAGGAVREIFPKAEKIETREELSKLANLSGKTIRKVEVVDKEAIEPIIEAMESNVISINKAYEIHNSIKEMPKDEQISEFERIRREKLSIELDKIDEDFKIFKKIRTALEAPFNIENTLTEENIRIYLKNNNTEGDIVSILRRIDYSIEALNKAKDLIQNYNKPKVVKFHGEN